jgi:hypothetical protein
MTAATDMSNSTDDKEINWLVGDHYAEVRTESGVRINLPLFDSYLFQMN